MLYYIILYHNIYIYIYIYIYLFAAHPPGAGARGARLCWNGAGQARRGESQGGRAESERLKGR